MDLKTFHKISYGLYVITSVSDGNNNGMIGDALMQITSDPPVIAVSINKKNLTHDFIQKSNVLNISVLSQNTPFEFIGKFGFKSGRDGDKFNNVNYKMGKNNAAVVLDNAVGYFETKVINSIDCGTHTIFLCEVLDCETLNDDEVMTYAYYQKVKGGKSPKTAPTYVDENKQKEVKKMDRYVCIVCGYVYDPEVGDPDSGIAPGTPFEQIPDSWSCPICGVSKDSFEKEV